MALRIAKLNLKNRLFSRLREIAFSIFGWRTVEVTPDIWGHFWSDYDYELRASSKHREIRASKRR